jgi:hypothetical protein
MKISTEDLKLLIDGTKRAGPVVHGFSSVTFVDLLQELLDWRLAAEALGAPPKTALERFAQIEDDLGRYAIVQAQVRDYDVASKAVDLAAAVQSFRDEEVHPNECWPPQKDEDGSGLQWIAQ